jgi:hypothetical protein
MDHRPEGAYRIVRPGRMHAIRQEHDFHSPLGINPY